jgi:hypothetical protein
MATQRPFPLLLKIFRDRFFENDSASPGGGFETNINQVLGLLAAIGVFVGYFVMPAFLALSLDPPTPETVWELRILRMFFPTYAFAVAAFAAVFHWDMLFPDRRDFLVLTPFPIRLHELIAAKFAALMLFLLLIAVPVNLAPDFMVSLAAIMAPKLRGTGLRLAGAQMVAAGGAFVFAFLSVAAFQGILINLTSTKFFRRISPWIQMAGLSLTVLTLLSFPVYAGLLKPGIEKRQLWLYLFPPAWFSGVYELFLGGPNQLLVSLGKQAFEMTALMFVIVVITWALGFRRHFRRTLETEDAPHRPHTWTTPEWLVRTPREGALMGFIGKTLARSPKHQFFLAAYLSAGLSVSAILAIAVRDGKVILSPGGARAVPFVLGFFFITAFRAAFQFPAELSANWLFRITESKWTEVSRSATRKLVLAIGLIPALILVLPIEFAQWTWPTILEHSLVQLFAAALMIEAIFWNFDKVPFTCSYFPGRKSLALLVFLYVYGLTGYAFHMADLEVAMERHWPIALLFFAVTSWALVWSWRRHREVETVRFDGSEPVIQTLELT